MTTNWPALEYEEQLWKPVSADLGVTGGRSLGGATNRYRSAIPPLIASLPLTLPSAIAALAEDASYELTRFDAELGDEVAPFAPLLLRSEAVASSQIENLTASARAVFSAELGDTSRRNARVIVANSHAMLAALEIADRLTPDSVLAMHRVLMEGDLRHVPGKWRAEPVWIGRSGDSPVGAEYVAPESSRVPGLISDLMRFARRDDLPVLAQAAVAHAQFETVHPFTDGNGRTGRSLLQAMLRGKGLTRSVTVPVSAGLLTDVDGYHSALTEYRNGDVAAIVQLTAKASLRAIGNSRILVDNIRATRARWSEVVSARSDSAVWKVLDLVARQPVVSAALVGVELAISPTNAYRHLDRLAEAGVLKAKTEYKVGRLWRSDEILRALDAFAERSGRRSVPSVFK